MLGSLHCTTLRRAPAVRRLKHSPQIVDAQGAENHVFWGGCAGLSIHGLWITVPAMSQLETIQAVVDRLGGTFGTAIKLGLGESAVGNWIVRGRIPPLHYLAISRALAKVGATASPGVFGFRDYTQTSPVSRSALRTRGAL